VVLAVEDLTLEFSGLHALTGVSMSVDAGALAALVGPNGAGKTCLLNCVGGFYAPTSGRIVFGDVPIQGLPPHRIAAHGITRGQWYFLRVLWTEDGLSQRELSARVGMMEPTTVIALRSMEKTGLIRRVRSADDKRVTKVWLTAKAKRMREEMLLIARGINEDACDGVSRAEFDAFRRAIARMTANLDRIGR